jgi:hypothetical protein
MEKANTGKSGAVRVSTLDATDLAAMERHGRREDASGQARRVSDDEPLVFGGLDICGRQEGSATSAEGARVFSPSEK